MKRVRLSDRQCSLLVEDMFQRGHEVSYEQIRNIADQIADGTYDENDTIARLLVEDIDAAVAFRKEQGMPDLPPEINE